MKRTRLSRGTKPLARRKELKASPESVAAFVERGRTSELLKRNPDRIKRLRAKQFGPKREWLLEIAAGVCQVTGLHATDMWPIDPAHTGSPDPDERGQSTRAAGADDTYLLAMRRDVHTAYDSLPEAKWEELAGMSKTAVREMAAELDRVWKANQSTGGET